MPAARRRVENPDPVDIHVGARLRLRRNLLGMSQDQLGKASGLTFQQIQKYERGINRMGASRLFQMGQILKVPVTYFFDDMSQLVGENMGLAENPQAVLEDVGGARNLLNRRETLELIRAYYRITDPRQRRKIYELIKAMSDKDEDDDDV